MSSSIKQIHIGIDGNEANVLHRVGSNRFAYNLLSAIYHQNQESLITVYLKSKPMKDMPAPNDRWQYQVITPTFWWTQIRLPLALLTQKHKPDVFFTPGHYRPRFAPMPTAITILDLAFLHYPNLFLSYKRGAAQLKHWTNYSVRHANHIFAISNTTKQDILKTYNLNPSRVSVVYPGIDTAHFSPPSKSAIDSVRNLYHLPESYILYIGTLQPRKNLSRLVKAFSNLPPKYASYHLIIGGEKGWKYQKLLQDINQSKKKGQIHLVGFIDNHHLPALYAQAAALVLVGLYEGFGIPPAEAIACGTLPVIAKTGALPEVVGKNAIAVDPYSVQSIKQGIIKAISATPSQKKVLLNQYKSHIQQFTWESSAQKVLNKLYELAP